MAGKIKNIRYLQDGEFTSTPLGADVDNIDIVSSLATIYATYGIDATDLSDLLGQLIEYVNSSYAVTNHASTTTAYGLGTPTTYGHVKVTHDYTTEAEEGLVPSVAAIQNLASDLASSSSSAESCTVTTDSDGNMAITYESGAYEEIIFVSSSEITDTVYSDSSKTTQVSKTTIVFNSDDSITITEE